MSKQFHQALKTILDMPYYKNDQARSGATDAGHEQAVADRVESAGFTAVSKAQHPKLTKSLLRRWAEGGSDQDLRRATEGMPPGSFIVQPAGSQGFPDILVRDFNDRFIALECKSGKNGQCPMWNDNTPKPMAIYVLSSGVQNSTTVFMGRDVITAEEQSLMDELQTKLTAIVKEYAVKLTKVDRFNRGWIQKARKQHFQGGGSEKTNYFTHSQRSICEKNALDYAQQ
jgi:hypothetical protein